MTVNLHVHRPLHDNETGLYSMSVADDAVPPSFKKPLQAQRSEPARSNARLSVGLHPWHVASADLDVALRRIEEAMPVADAVGECGLDLFVLKGLADREDRLEKQQAAFRAQLRIARAFSKPVILHVVRAADLVLAIREEFPEQTWIMHGFRGAADIASRLFQAGLYLSFGPALLGGKDPATEEAFRAAPADRIFLETDDCEIDIDDLYERAAALRHISKEAMKQITEANFHRIFIS